MSKNLPQIARSRKLGRSRYIDFISLFFLGTALSLPVQILILQGRMGNWQDWLDMPQELTVLNWLCMICYTASAVALQKNWSRVWTVLGVTFLVTAINNSFGAFIGFDYTLMQLLLGTLAIALPIAPLYFVKSLRWRLQAGPQQKTPAQRFKKRWKVEVLTPGVQVPLSGVTINISSTGALVHWYDHTKVNQEVMDLRLTDAQHGKIIDCKAKAVRVDNLLYGDKPFPVMGMQFVNLTKDQEESLATKLAGDKLKKAG